MKYLSGMRRILSLLIVIVITHLPLGCYIGDDCGGYTPLEARITDITSVVGVLTSSGFSNSRSTEFDEAAINVSIAGIEYIEISDASQPGFSFINSAYACSPPEPPPTQAITSIQITSESSVFFGGEEYASGQDLSQLFIAADYLYARSPTTIAEFIEQQNQDLYIFGYDGANVAFQLGEKPDSTINQPFSVTFQLSDAEVLETRIQVFEVSN